MQYEFFLLFFLKKNSFLPSFWYFSFLFYFKKKKKKNEHFIKTFFISEFHYFSNDQNSNTQHSNMVEKVCIWSSKNCKMENKKKKKKILCFSFFCFKYNIIAFKS